MDLRVRLDGLLLGVGGDGQLRDSSRLWQGHLLGGVSLVNEALRADVYGLYGQHLYYAWGASGADRGVDTALDFAGARAEFRFRVPHRPRDFVGLLVGWDSDLSTKHFEYTYSEDLNAGCWLCDEEDWMTYPSQQTVGESQLIVGFSAGIQFWEL